jgi:hypothetical protein
MVREHMRKALFFMLIIAHLAMSAECDNMKQGWLVCEDFEDYSGSFTSWYDSTEWYSDVAADRGRIDISTDAYEGDYALYMPAAASSGYKGGDLRWYDCVGDHTRPCERQGHDQYYLRAYFKLAPDHEYVHHFLTMGASQPEREQFWDSMGLAGCRPDGIISAGTTVDFNRDRQSFFYTYSPDMGCDPGYVCDRYADATRICSQCASRGLPCLNGEECCWGNHYPRTPATNSIIPRDEWVCLEMTMRLNTIGAKDGYMAYWMNDQLIHNKSGMYWRVDPELQMNSINIQHYIDSGEADQPNRIWWDNIVLSENRIGCYKSCDNPDIHCVDDTPGVTQEYADIQSALDIAGEGDTVLIYPGVYQPRARLEVRASGSAGKPITISGIGRPVIDGSRHTSDILNVESHDYIVIEGLEVKNAGRSGIRLTHSDHSIVRDNFAHHNRVWGIFTSFCDDMLIEGNECSFSEVEHGIYFSNSGDRPIIRGNRVHDNNANGIHMNGDINIGSDTYSPVDGVISGALVENNIIYGNGRAGGSAINCDGVRDSIIRNNVIYDQHSSGISLYQIDGGQKSEGNQVYHNSIVIASDGRWALNLKGESSRNTIYNNILLNQHATHGSIAADSTAGLLSDNNIITAGRYAVTPDDDGTYLSLTEWQARGFDLNSRPASIADTFISYPADMRLTSSSLAIDSGRVVAVPADIQGNARPSGNGYDIGAYESGYSLQKTCPAGDTDGNGVISLHELSSHMANWKSGSLNLAGIMQVIRLWKQGC